MSVDLFPPPRRIQTEDGAAEAELSDDGRALRLTYRDGQRAARLVLELDPRRGQLTMAVPAGDLRIVTREGAIELDAATAVRVRAPETEIATGRWTVRATQIRQRAATILHEAEETIHTRARRMRTAVRGMYQVITQSTRMRSKDDTAIDGRRILLG